MTSESRHIAESIDRSPGEVYEYASNPANLPEWARGVGDSVEFVDGQWVASSPAGRVVIDFAARNAYGILDHEVTLPTGETVHNPMRVIADGPACEVVFTLRRRSDRSGEDFQQDADAVSADLATLKEVLERR